VPPSPDQREDGVGALEAMLASLQPALATAQLRMARGDRIPRWFAPPAPAASNECIEVLACDGTLLFVSDSAALPVDLAERGDPEPAFWLRQGNEDARRALEAANAGQMAQFHAVAETQDGDVTCWDVVVTPMLTDTGTVDALLVVSRRAVARPREEALRQREEALHQREDALRQSAETLRRREAAIRQGDATALRDTMERLNLVLNAGPVVGTWVWDVPADRVIADMRLAKRLAIDPARIAAGLRMDEFLASVHLDDRARVSEAIAQARRQGGDFQVEYRLAGEDGEPRWVQARGCCALDGAGQPLRCPGVLVDVHDRVSLERAAQAKSERQMALLTLGDQLRDARDVDSISALSSGLVGRLLGASHAGYSAIDPQIGRITVRWDWTDGTAASIVGTYESSSFGTAVARLQRGLPIVEEDLWVADWLAPSDRESYRAMGIRALVTLPLLRDARLISTMFVAATARRAWAPDEVRFVRDVADRSWAAIERVQSEDALRASAAELRLVADSMPAMIAQLDPSLVYRFVNRASVDWFGLPPEQIIGRRARDILGPDGFEWRQPYFDAALDGRKISVEADWPHRDGTPRIAEIHYSPRWDARGVHDGFYAFVLDITDRKRAEQRLQGSAQALEAEMARRTADRDRMWHLSTDIMLVATFDGVIEALNPAWAILLGWDEAELVGGNFLDLVHPDDVAVTRVELAGLAAGDRSFHIENRLRHRDGTYRWVSWSGVSDEHLMHAAGRDITAERERASLQRQLEEELRQSQKMGAVGQLTGGLAHDFNNLLTGITGNLELLQGHLAQGQLENLDRYIQAAQGSAVRAAALTHRLLAFSRRQTLDPKPTDVNQLVRSMEELIHGTVGPAIHVATVLRAHVPPTLCDPNQLENALLNLCLNARDAMPAGGRLVIETADAWLDERALESDVAPGHYVTMSVSDTGTGMTSEVAARAFDSFFTTKPLGEGTGLGLSMIHGFVKQSGGQMRVHTEVGRGTTMQLYLPSHGTDPAPDAASSTDPAPRAAAGETVLLVDDEPAIRLLVMEVLRELGYQAIEAEDGLSGLAVLQSDRRIDLLISDVGLPGGMNGRQLADAGRQLRPDLKVLFVTGYAADTDGGVGALGPRTHLLAKPFSMGGLAAKIAAALAAD
jgi:PAS domain S-box-containing protein